ncbi:MAG: caspase family protein [Candidatus Obscuribacterales bacterium]|nr:caspase family protein [Candidatus Obscuribacterales bacterium]
MNNRWIVALIAFVAGINILLCQPVQCETKSVSDQSSSGLQSFGDKWAVVVGLDTYSDRALNTVLPLHETAKRVSDALISKGFAKDHVRVMLNRDATRQAILSSISSSWLGKLSRKTDLAVVFLANQCFPANDGKVYLLPYDTRLANFFATAVSVEEILEELRSHVQAKQLVLVFQTSFCGSPEMMAGCKTMFGHYNVSIHAQDLPDNYTVLVSSKPSQPTWGTYFSDNLAEDLSLNEGNASISTLFSKVKTDTINDTAKDCSGCKVQTPIMISKSDTDSIGIGGRPSKPVVELPAEISTYLKGQEIYSTAQSVLDAYRAVLARQEDWTAASNGSVAPARRLDTAISTGSLPEELLTRIDDSLKSMTVYLKENSDFAPGHYVVGRLYLIKDDKDKALTAMQEAARLSPNSASYHSWLARTQERLGKDATDEWQSVYKLNRKSFSAIDSLASHAIDSGKYDQAAQLIGEGLVLYPGDAGLHVRMSNVLKQQGKMKHAIEHAQEAVFLDEHSFDALVNLGALLIATRDEHGAHAAFRQALELGAPQAEHYYVLAEGLEKTKDPEGAILALTKFVDGTAKDDRRMIDAKKRLDELKKASQ